MIKVLPSFMFTVLYFLCLCYYLCIIKFVDARRSINDFYDVLPSTDYTKSHLLDNEVLNVNHLQGPPKRHLTTPRTSLPIDTSYKNESLTTQNVTTPISPDSFTQAFDHGINGIEQQNLTIVTEQPDSQYSGPPVNASANISSDEASSSDETTENESGVSPTTAGEAVAIATDIPTSNKVTVGDEVALEDNTATSVKTTYHKFYSSTIFNDKNKGRFYWVDMKQQKGVKVNSILSDTYRNAKTVKLSFSFPFYGHYKENVTVTTGGFIFTGNIIYNNLAATQYIAPLMANFDLRLSNESFIRYVDNGTAFTVEWERVRLQDHPSDDGFTFQVTLHKSGDIIFAYKNIPIPIENISHRDHPLKVGLSDAYMNERSVFLIKRKVIYEYHRVELDKRDIRNWTVVDLKPLPACLDQSDCSSRNNNASQNVTTLISSDSFERVHDLNQQQNLTNVTEQPNSFRTSEPPALAEISSKEADFEKDNSQVVPIDALTSNNKTVEDDRVLEDNTATAKTTYHKFYSSTIFNDKNKGRSYWVDMKQQKGFKVNSILSDTYRNAKTVKLSFSFPFYGHYKENVTVTTGGFIFTGNIIHNNLAATQYIAPLMANFDLRLCNESFIRYVDNGTAFTVEWERVRLQDQPSDDGFTFQVTLHKSGDIIFAYKNIPIPIENISHRDHPVNVGLSDAYMNERSVFLIKRKVIYEYDRVELDKRDIRNWTVVHLKPLLACLDQSDCSSRNNNASQNVTTLIPSDSFERLHDLNQQQNLTNVTEQPNSFRTSESPALAEISSKEADFEKDNSEVVPTDALTSNNKTVEDDRVLEAITATAETSSTKRRKPDEAGYKEAPNHM